MKRRSALLVLCLSAMGISSCLIVPKRTINQLPPKPSADQAILVGRMRAQKPPKQVIPSFDIQAASGATALTISNISGSAANEELTFWGAVPPGRYHLNEYWWADAKKAPFSGPVQITVEAGKINYIGDILLTETTGESGVGLSVEIEDGKATLVTAEKATIDKVGWPVTTTLLER
jgi:hypothetical protein